MLREELIGFKVDELGEDFALANRVSAQQGGLLHGVGSETAARPPLPHRLQLVLQEVTEAHRYRMRQPLVEQDRRGVAFVLAH